MVLLVAYVPRFLLFFMHNFIYFRDVFNINNWIFLTRKMLIFTQHILEGKYNIFLVRIRMDKQSSRTAEPSDSDS